MATIVFSWELGAGLGHLGNIRDLMQRLAARGHRIVFATADPARLEARDRTGICQVWQTPPTEPLQRRIDRPFNFAQILHNSGFETADGLARRAEAWRLVLQSTKGAVLVADHSPTALLAARSLPMRRATIGTGFFCPPDVSPWPNLRTWLTPDAGVIERDEVSVLQNINRVLCGWSCRPLERLAQLYHPADEHFLLSFAELDPYPARGAATYRGMWQSKGGEVPDWPRGAGPKVFAYLKPFPALMPLMHHLRDCGSPVLAVVANLPPISTDGLASGAFRLTNNILDMPRVARECDVAILNGTPATTVAMLLAGKPTLQIPLYLDQGLVAHAIAQLGAGVVSRPNNPQGIIRGLDRLFSEATYRQMAQRFAERYASFDPDEELEQVTNRIERLANADGAVD